LQFITELVEQDIMCEPGLG